MAEFRIPVIANQAEILSSPGESFSTFSAIHPAIKGIAIIIFTKESMSSHNAW
jgi:hypothetical protein